MATKDKAKDAAAEEGAEPAPPKKSSIKLIIVGVVVLWAVGGGGAFAWFKFLAPAKAKGSERIPQVRDAILILLSGKDTQTLKPTAGKLQLWDEILQRINSLLSSGQARNAYFTEFVVQ